MAGTSANPMSRKLNTDKYTWIPLIVNVLLLLILLAVYVYLHVDIPTVSQVGKMGLSMHTSKV